VQDCEYMLGEQFIEEQRVAPAIYNCLDIRSAVGIHDERHSCRAARIRRDQERPIQDGSVFGLDLDLLRSAQSIFTDRARSPEGRTAGANTAHLHDWRTSPDRELVCEISAHRCEQSIVKSCPMRNLRAFAF